MSSILPSHDFDRDSVRDMNLDHPSLIVEWSHEPPICVIQAELKTTEMQFAAVILSVLRSFFPLMSELVS